MVKRNKKIRIVIDLDGVLIDKPPLIPKFFIEFLFRGLQKKELSYRYPKTTIEKWIRKLSHFYLFRPAMSENISYLKELAGNDKIEIFVLSGRYSFLEKETMVWLKKRGIITYFKEIHLNLGDQQPHVFKEKILKKFKPDIYVDDDERLVVYLDNKCAGIRLFCLSGGRKLSDLSILSDLS